ncbi:MAG TPA: hypothetical protein VF463_13455 [Sphingobium sp.]
MTRKAGDRSDLAASKPAEGMRDNVAAAGGWGALGAAARTIWEQRKASDTPSSAPATQRVAA